MFNNCLVPSSLPLFFRQIPAIPTQNSSINIRAQMDQGGSGNIGEERRKHQATTRLFQQKGWLPKPNITINQILRIDRDIGSFRTTPEIEKKYNDQLHPDLNEWLENRLKERIEKTPDLSKIPEANLKAVLEYTMGFGGVNYQHMNTALRNGNRTELAKYEPYIFNLISALNQFPVFEGPVYRSIKASYTKSIERYLVTDVTQPVGCNHYM